jgi:hypothetical protein
VATVCWIRHNWADRSMLRVILQWQLSAGSDTSGQIGQCYAWYFSGNCLLDQTQVGRYVNVTRDTSVATVCWIRHKRVDISGHECYFSGNCLLGQAYILKCSSLQSVKYVDTQLQQLQLAYPEYGTNCKHSSVFVSATRCAISLQHLTVTEVGYILPAFYDPS